MITSIWNVIEHVDNLEYFIYSCSKSTKRNGWLIFDCNNIFNKDHYGSLNFYLNKLKVLAGLRKFKFKIPSHKNANVNMYDPKLIKSVLINRGFSIENIIYLQYSSGKEVNDRKGQALYFCMYLR